MREGKGIGKRTCAFGISLRKEGRKREGSGDDSDVILIGTMHVLRQTKIKINVEKIGIGK